VRTEDEEFYGRRQDCILPGLDHREVSTYHVWNDCKVSYDMKHRISLGWEVTLEVNIKYGTESGHSG
jgi:hypothetical protein